MDQRQYERLYGEFRRAINDAHEAMKVHGADSPQFAGADATAGEIWKQMREMQGMKGAHWSD